MRGISVSPGMTDHLRSRRRGQRGSDRGGPVALDQHQPPAMHLTVHTVEHACRFEQDRGPDPGGGEGGRRAINTANINANQRMAISLFAYYAPGMTSLARTPLLALALLLTAPLAPDPEMTRWRAEAANVTITRDDWGIAHITGKTDADAVFGMIYAQAEDDFGRIEANYLTSLGRTAEAPGADDDAGWEDLRQRLFVDPAELKKEYAGAQPWLKKLMNAWADGLNYYLATHPGTKPKVLTRFEPWMALSFTEGTCRLQGLYAGGLIIADG